MRTRSFRRTIVASTVGLMTVAMVLIVLGIQVVLDHTARRDVEQVLRDRSDAVVSVLQQASTDTLTVPPDALEPGMVVYDAAGARVDGSVERGVREAADRLSTTERARTMQGPTDEVRLLGTPFDTPSGESGVLVISQDAGPYERSEHYALLAALVLGLLVIGATALVALRVTRQALAPVAQMAERAADWSEHDLTHRFALGPPTNELGALGETLDHLLDRVASAILAEQRLTSELAHELRTPLTAIKGSADLALMRGVADPATRADLEQISASAREMSEVISTLLDVARDGRAGGEQSCRLVDAVPALVAAAGEEVEVVDLVAGSDARVAAPLDLVVRAASPVVANAARHARTQVTLRAVDLGDRVGLQVSDDGPGVDPSVRDRVFDPGVSAAGGAGLGLGIARRVARSFGGEVRLAGPTAPGETSAGAGACFVVELPSRCRRTPGAVTPGW